MSGSALAYTYRYAGESAVLPDPAGPKLRLATQVAPSAPALFLRGRLLAPRRTGELLLTLMEVVDARFFVPGAMLAAKLRLADPVVTCGRERLRFEAFSQCCGAYARVDLLANAIDGELLNRGTTNVDFNPPMRAGLARLSDAGATFLTIGADRVELESDRAQVVERKVKLPERWLRGFVEVQAFQSRMEPAFRTSGAALRRFLSDIRKERDVRYVSLLGSILRVSAVREPNTVPVGGLDRLKVLARAARHAESVDVYGDPGSGASTWVIHTPEARFQYVLSPEPSRGFSGEGQVLERLVDGSGPALGTVRACLRWQDRIDPVEIAASSGQAPQEIARGLAACAATGLVGYDVADGGYFHRELPFDLSLIAKHQARLAGAQALQEEGAVSFDGPESAWVQSGDTRYRVWLGDAPRCTCPWIGKHGTSRGPCKHILSAQALRKASA